MILKLTRKHLKNLYSEMGDNDVLVIDTNEEEGMELSLEKVVKTYVSLCGTKESWIDRFAEATDDTFKEGSKSVPSDKGDCFTQEELIALAKAQTVIDRESYYKERPLLLACTRGKKIHTLIGTSVNKGRESDDYLVNLFDKGVKEGLLTNHD